MSFKEIDVFQQAENPFSLIGRDWMLVTAGDDTHYNTMTASWGQMGILWNEPVVSVYIRPQRYTREFVEAQPRFSLCFFEGNRQRPALQLLGTKSGREMDKIGASGLHVTMIDEVPAFEEARLVLICQKLYQQDLQPACFLEPALIDRNYPDHDFHRLYVAKIEKAYCK